MQKQILVPYLLFLLIAMVFETLAFKIHYYVTKTHYKEHHYTFGKYLFFLTFPMLASLFLFYQHGWGLLKVFIGFAFTGTLLEWMIGWSYYNIVGQRLWTYHRYAITKYTSFLSIPLWGFAGVLFWIMVKLFE